MDYLQNALPLLPYHTNDKYFLQLAFKLKNNIIPPSQSNFRVYAIVIFQDDKTPKDKISYVLGTNIECCFISNNICAERSAITQLRHRRGCVVLRVIIVCDSQEYITPGVLCREFMFDNYCSKNTIITVSGENKVPRTFTLGELYPYPNIYHKQVREDVTSFAIQFSKKAKSPEEYFETKNSQWKQLYKKIKTIAVSDEALLHPIVYVAGILFTNKKNFYRHST